MENFENIRLPWPDWKIVKCLGSGAYGKVYEIERTISGMQEKVKAALKIVSRPRDEDEIEGYYGKDYDKAEVRKAYEMQIQSYIQEYKLMKELQWNSNIVSWEDFTVVPHEDGIGGDIFMRMELLTPLNQILKERMLSEEEVIKLGKDISRALILYENIGMICRNIKPQNIMVSAFGDYKIGDFRMPEFMDHAPFAGGMGHPGFYQAPEITRMEKYGYTADIYSLGSTLYWLLNNQRIPFIGADEPLNPVQMDKAMMRRYRGEKIPAPKNGSEKLKRIVLKACEYRPEDRYASAQELYDALDEMESGNYNLKKDFEKIYLPWSGWKIVKDFGHGIYEITRYKTDEDSVGTGEQEENTVLITRSIPNDEIDNCSDEESMIADYEDKIQNYVQKYKKLKELQGEPGIVRCDDVAVVPHKNGIGGDIFIRMELIKKSLYNVDTIQEIIKLGKDISHALILYEKKGISHCAISPEDIMISKTGDYKLREYTLIFTMTGADPRHWLAPEGGYGQAADIYALGIVMYDLLDRIETYKGFSEGREKLPVLENGNEALKQIILKACAYRPEDRYASAQELYDALDEMESGNYNLRKDFEKIHLPWQDWKIVRDLGGGRKEKVYEIKRCGKESPFVIPDQVNKAALKIISIPDDENEIKWRFEGCDEKSIIAHYEDEIQKYEQKYERIKQLEDDSNIVNCYEVAVVPHENGIGGDIFIQMELIEKSLRDVVKKENLSIEDIIELGKDISRALLVCETWEISHCGIRPENIVRSQSGDWKLRDYTVGVFYDPLICYNMERPVYWAPESNFGQAADIYALGIVMYELLNQQSMHFMGMSYMENLPAPKRGSEELKQIVLKACAYKPEDRYASAQELYDALDAVDVPEVPRNGEHFSNRAKQAERLLSKIEVEKLTAKNVIRTIICGIVVLGIATAMVIVGASARIDFIAVIGSLIPYGVLYWFLFRMGAADFSEWMKVNKEKIKDFDKYIKTNPEFARRLYYEKCRKKYLLEYMNRLNPNVVKSIKESKRIRK